MLRGVPARLAAGLLVAPLLVGGCGAGRASTLPDTPVDSRTVPPTTYVAMGDSYTAAPLFPIADDLVVDSCLRSDENYPALVADALRIDVDDVSCSGASTGAVFAGQEFSTHRRPPQLDALSPDTDLVTIGIGANDFRFFGEMIFDCLAVAPRDVAGSPCRDRNLGSDGHDRILANLDEIRARVGEVVAAVVDRAPNARVVLVGYPQLLPGEGTCRRRLPLAVGDYAYALDLNLRLAAAVEQGGVAAGAAYVDLVAASQGHDICSDQPWVAGIRGRPRRAAGLHPYPAEQQAVADLVLALL